MKINSRFAMGLVASIMAFGTGTCVVVTRMADTAVTSGKSFLDEVPPPRPPRPQVVNSVFGVTDLFPQLATMRPLAENMIVTANSQPLTWRELTSVESSASIQSSLADAQTKQQGAVTAFGRAFSDLADVGLTLELRSAAKSGGCAVMKSQIKHGRLPNENEALQYLGDHVLGRALALGQERFHNTARRAVRSLYQDLAEMGNDPARAKRYAAASLFCDLTPG